MFWSWLGSFLAGPLLGKALDAYKAKLAAGNTEDGIKADLAAKEVLLQQRELELQAQYRIAEIGHWYEPDKIMGYCVAIYFGKLLVIDKVMGWGTTDPLAGFAETTANLIVAFYFAKRGFENIARIIKR
jgi:hypothetical protein